MSPSSVEPRSRTRVRKPRVALLVISFVFVAIAVIATAAGAVALTPQSAEHATAARALRVLDETRMHRTSEVGATIIEEGTATGSLPGRIKARVTVGASVSTTAVLYARGGSINIRGVGVMRSSGAIANFSGVMTANGGSGQYTHAHGKATISGVVNRRNWAMTLRTNGTLSY